MKLAAFQSPAFRPRVLSWAIAVWSALILLAVILFSRRLAGGFGAYPSPPRVVFWTGFFLAVSVCCAFAVASFAVGRRIGKRVLTGIAVIAPCAMGLTLCGPGATGSQMAVITLGLLSFVVVPALLPVRNTPVEDRRTDSDATPLKLASLSNENEAVASEHSGQWMQRIDAATIEGVALVEFAAGQKQAVTHVPFSPPLTSRPNVECEPMDGLEVRWKVGVALPFGIRIDVTRQGNVEQSATASIAYFATAGKSNDQVA